MKKPESGKSAAYSSGWFVRTPEDKNWAREVRAVASQFFGALLAVAGLLTEPRQARSETGPSCPQYIEVIPRVDDGGRKTHLGI